MIPPVFPPPLPQPCVAPRIVIASEAASNHRYRLRPRFLVTGKIRNGIKINAAADPESVSVKTTVIAKVPEGVEDVVVIVSAPELDE